MLNGQNYEQYDICNSCYISGRALLIGAIAITQSVFASSDGNTITKEKNKGKAIASGFGTITANVQPNAVCAEVEACIGGATDGNGGIVRY